METKTILFILLILCFSALFCFACAKETQSVSMPKDTNTANYAKPNQAEHTEEEQKLLDRYYSEMVEKYPQFKEIPRDMLWESVWRSGDFSEVTFAFCLGGAATGCECQFRTSKKNPDGEWTVTENEFRQFYTSGLSEELVSTIKTQISDGILSCAKANHLELKTEAGTEQYFTWEIIDGKFYASAEAIGNCTPLTLKKFGCGDHAHIFARIRVEFAGDQISLSPCNVTAS